MNEAGGQGGATLGAGWRVALAVLFAACLATLVGRAVLAQDSSEDATAAGGQRAVIRFLTTDDYPPFNSRDEEGVLTGLNIDLARAICLDLATACDLQVRPWEGLIDDLVAGRADAVIAAHKITGETLARADFTHRYFYTPARFAVRREGGQVNATPTDLDGRTAAVVAGSPHEAFLARYFRNTSLKPFQTPEEAREAMVNGKVDLIFGDGISLSFWANGTLSRNCCRLLEGPFFEPAYFGDGVAIVIGKGDRELRQQLNDALKRIKISGRFQELVDRYFPIRVY